MIEAIEVRLYADAWTRKHVLIRRTPEGAYEWVDGPYRAGTFLLPDLVDAIKTAAKRPRWGGVLAPLNYGKPTTVRRPVERSVWVPVAGFTRPALTPSGSTLDVQVRRRLFGRSVAFRAARHCAYGYYLRWGQCRRAVARLRAMEES